MKTKLYNYFALCIEKLCLTPRVFLPSLEDLLRRRDEKGQCDLDIVFLCKGNICRSPYAEQKLKSLLREHRLLDVKVQSAGLDTTPGKPADSLAQSVAKKRGIELSAHVTKAVTPELLCAASLIFVMEPAQLRLVRTHFPESCKKSFLLGALSLSQTHKISIGDPYAGSEATFEKCFEQIDASLQKFVEALTRPRGERDIMQPSEG